MDKNYDLVVAGIERSQKAYVAVITSEEERALYRDFQQAWTTYFAATQNVLAAPAETTRRRLAICTSRSHLLPSRQTNCLAGR